MRRLRLATVAALLVAALALAACSGGSDDEATPSPTPPPTATAPAATRTPPPSLPPVPASFDFEHDAISFSYEADWRISASSEQSVTLTLKEAPGGALLTVQWQPRPATGDLEAQYLQQLTTAGQALEQLTDTEVDGLEAHRYASLIGEDDAAAIALSVLFNSSDTAYLVIFTSTPDDFGVQAPLVDAVLETIVLP